MVGPNDWTSRTRGTGTAGLETTHEEEQEMTSESFDGVMDDWHNAAVTLKTKAVTRQVLCVLCEQVLFGYPVAVARTLRPDISDEVLGAIRENAVDELRSHVEGFLDHFSSEESPWGLPFILKIDESLRAEWESKKDEISEAFIEEMHNFFDSLEPGGKQAPNTSQFDEYGTYSRLYGSDSAWN